MGSGETENSCLYAVERRCAENEWIRFDLINKDEVLNGKKRQSVDDRDEMGVGKEEKRR